MLPVSSFALTWCHSGIQNEIFEWPTLCQNLARAVYSVMGAHLGSVKIQRHAKSFSLSSWFPLRLFVPLTLTRSLSLSLVVNGDVKYLNTLCCAGTMHSSRWTGPARVGCMQISIQSSPGCFQSNTSASGPVLIPLYPQPARFFYQVKRRKRCVNLDIWPHHETRGRARQASECGREDLAGLKHLEMGLGYGKTRRDE